MSIIVECSACRCVNWRGAARCRECGHDLTGRPCVCAKCRPVVRVRIEGAEAVEIKGRSR